ncbi:MAG: DUF1573 domain-containing protein [Prevotella sp.]|nr:DUF1573 domain-containing protein [Prevotella sp.]MCI1473887.1 DUF1573 domain-containing protein [Prevotella sp.]MCI1518909.1 DUF1573 domain-containing protein [Prevotella sp.]MCI1549564.1 DUF1573 domain-containing protein [Prevotella sp.]MCI1595285.1 DUF1573 domain-containing protein [Prevotella sp.]
MSYRRLVLAVLLLSGTMVVSAQQISVSQSTVECGEVIYKHPVTAVFQLRNASRHSLTIAEVRTSCGCVDAHYPDRRIDREKKFEISVTYDARLLGHFRKAVEVYAQGDKEPVTLWMQGIVVRDTIRDFNGHYPYQAGVMKVDKNDVEFEVHKGNRQVQKIYLFNPSQYVVEPVMLHLPDYLSAIFSPSKLSPGHAGIALLTVDSHQLHDFGLTQASIFLGTSPGDQVSPDKEITVSAVLLPPERNGQGQKDASAPVIDLSSSSLDLGSFGRKEKLKGSIRITNKGRQTLEIRSLQMFTLGLKVSLNKTKIESGEEARLKVTAFKSELKKSRSKPRILMITNAPNHEEVEIPILVRP